MPGIIGNTYGTTMTISAAHLTQFVIKPTLESLDMYSQTAEKLLLGTAAQESGFNPLKTSGDALGIYQITPDRHRNVWDQYLAFRPNLASKVRGLASQHQFLKAPDLELRTNMAYSTAIAWAIYLQSDVQFPEADDAEGLSLLWQQNFSHAKTGHIETFARWIRDNTADA